jgi:hypothetical protein
MEDFRELRVHESVQYSQYESSGLSTIDRRKHFAPPIQLSFHLKEEEKGG